jgi:zinc transport system ATP-binding protein
MRVIDLVLMSRIGRERLFRRLRRRDREIARRALARVNAADLADEQVNRLSGGQLQRVLIARSLAVNARILILDEPAASLDPLSAQELYELLARLSPPLTVILVSHDIGVISSRVRSVACLNRRLHYHPSNEITHEMIEMAYGAHTDLVIHRHSHRILRDHPGPEKN